jgi:hypothetical protein
MSPATVPVTLAGRELAPPRHVCCFFDSTAQQYEVLIPYLREGLDHQEKILAVMDREPLAGFRARLEAAGIATAAAEGSGQLGCHCSDDTYLAGGAFSKERVLRMLEDELREVARGPWLRLRTCGDMAWAQRDMPGTEELLEYESEVNALLDHHDATFLCLYDASRISGQTMLDVLGTHSHVLIGSEIRENPYYMKPAQYRQTLLARRSSTRRLTRKDSDTPR